jgi:hypothetical protein
MKTYRLVLGGGDLGEADDLALGVHVAVVRQGGDTTSHLAAHLARNTKDLGVGFLSTKWKLVVKYKQRYQYVRGRVHARSAPNTDNIPAMCFAATRREMGLQFLRGGSDALEKGGGGCGRT